MVASAEVDPLSPDCVLLVGLDLSGWTTSRDAYAVARGKPRAGAFCPTERDGRLHLVESGLIDDFAAKLSELAEIPLQVWGASGEEDCVCDLLTQFFSQCPEYDCVTKLLKALDRAVWDSVLSRADLAARAMLGMLVPTLARQPEFLTAPIVVAIDAPFGLPEAAVTYARRDRDLSHPAPLDRESWLWRECEQRLTKAGIQPLSSVGSAVGAQASKAQALVDRLRRGGAKLWPCPKRAGVLVVEAYPAATLWALGRRHGDYKSRRSNDPKALHSFVRTCLAASLASEGPGHDWAGVANALDSGGPFGVAAKGRSVFEDDLVQPRFAEGCAGDLVATATEDGADQLDACICALTAWCTHRGWCVPPPDTDAEGRARVEGWIAVPRTARWWEGVIMNKDKAAAAAAKEECARLAKDELMPLVNATLLVTVSDGALRALMGHVVRRCFGNGDGTLRIRHGDNSASGKPFDLLCAVGVWNKAGEPVKITESAVNLLAEAFGSYVVEAAQKAAGEAERREGAGQAAKDIITLLLGTGQ